MPGGKKYRRHNKKTTKKNHIYGHILDQIEALNKELNKNNNLFTFSFLITPIKWTLTALIGHEMVPKNEIVCPFL